jgi:hypothetical protein
MKSRGVSSCHFRKSREPCVGTSSSIVPRDLLLIWPQTRVGLHTTCIPEEREPIPDQSDRNTNVVDGVDTGDGLQIVPDGPLLGGSYIIDWYVDL